MGVQGAVKDFFENYNSSLAFKIEFWSFARNVGYGLRINVAVKENSIRQRLFEKKIFLLRFQEVTSTLSKQIMTKLSARRLSCQVSYG